MIKANYTDKPLVVDILSKAFDTNKSINYLVKQDSKRDNRIKALMEYSFDICYSFGQVFLSNDKKACALVLFPDNKKTTLKSVLLDLKLAFSCIGLTRIKRVLDREAKVKSLQPKEPFYYLWFIGVDPAYHRRGIGAILLNEVIEDSVSKKRPIYLETSTLKNIPWYKKFGFEIYNELDLSYKLFFVKKVLNQ